MSLEATHAHSQAKPTDTNSKLVADCLIYGSFHAVTGALAGHFFSLISPLGGAAFGIASGFTSVFAAVFLDQVFGNSTNEKVVKFVGKLLLSVAVGVGAALVIGAKLTVVNGIYLSILMVPVSIITMIALGCIQKLV